MGMGLRVEGWGVDFSLRFDFRFIGTGLSQGTVIETVSLRNSIPKPRLAHKKSKPASENNFAGREFTANIPGPGVAGIGGLQVTFSAEPREPSKFSLPRPCYVVPFRVVYYNPLPKNHNRPKNELHRSPCVHVPKSKLVRWWCCCLHRDV